MKTLRVSDSAHRKLTGLLGELTVQKRKMQTFADVIENLLAHSVIVPPDLLAEVEGFMKENNRLGYTTREEFIRDASRWRLKFLEEDFEYVEIPKEKYERLDDAMKEMNTPFYSASDFVQSKVEEVLEQFDKWLQEKEERAKRSRKKR